VPGSVVTARSRVGARGIVMKTDRHGLLRSAFGKDQGQCSTQKGTLYVGRFRPKAFRIT
jgi:hypothetical protein